MISRTYRLVIDKGFRKRLKKKHPQLQAAVMECIYRLAANPASPGLRVHPIRGTRGVHEAYVDAGNRVTFEYDSSQHAILMLNHCNHDILSRA
jgi:hypothetical protein